MKYPWNFPRRASRADNLVNTIRGRTIRAFELDFSGRNLVNTIRGRTIRAFELDFPWAKFG